MKKQFDDYIQGKCTPEDFRQVIGLIESTGRESEKRLNDLLFGYWDKVMKENELSRRNDGLLNAIHHRLALVEKINYSRVIRLYKIGISIAAIIIFALIFNSVIEDHSFNVADQTVSTPYGAKANFDLPDGSKIWLNSGSKLIYPNKFGIERSIYLEGEAFLEVKKSNRPFVVNSSYGQVRVLGTRFNIKAYGEEACEITLVEGSLKVQNNNRKEAILQPNYQAYQEGQDLIVRHVDTETFTSWKDGKLIFEREPFYHIVRRLERWYNVKIDVKDDAVKNLRYTGTIEMESFSEVLELIKATTPIVYSFDKNTRILSISSK